MKKTGITLSLPLACTLCFLLTTTPSKADCVMCVTVPDDGRCVGQIIKSCIDDTSEMLPANCYMSGSGLGGNPGTGCPPPPNLY